MDHVWDSKSAYRILVETSNEEGEGGDTWKTGYTYYLILLFITALAS